MEIKECYKIGYIVKNHGLKGGVTASLSEDLDETVDTVFLEINHALVPYFIKQVSGTSTKAIIVFEDISTVEKASALKGASIYLPKTLRPKLKRGNFYDDELIGYTVDDTHLGLLGSVTEVVSSGSNKLLSVANNGKEVLIPVNGPFIQTIKKTEKKITVELPEGFLNLNE
ncbi:MAG TPA: ribosome maturation factor RimM [Cyclobacteriaceae bacterium]|nr:ribosome maturation factor RimM [Cyclobacteriaceae bacterium]